MMALVDQVIYGKRIKQPSTNATSFYIFQIFNIIIIASLSVAINIDIKYLFDGFTPIMECAKWNILTFA